MIQGKIVCVTPHTGVHAPPHTGVHAPPHTGVHAQGNIYLGGRGGFLCLVG